MFGDPVSLDLPLDWRVLACTAAVTVLTAVLFGTAPALRGTRVTPIEVLKAEGAGVRLGGRAPRGLLVAQVALAMVLLVTAGLFVQTFERLASVALGFDSDRLLVVKVDATRAAIDPADRIRFYDRLVDAVAAVPGVARAAGSVTTPIDFGPVMVTPVEVPGSPLVPEPQRTLVTYFVTPGWFATYGTTIRDGRDVSDFDTASSLPVVVVNEAFARRFFPAESPIGKAVVSTWAPAGQVPRSRTIVGVVDNAVAMSLRDDAPATMYVPLAQHEWGRPLTEIQISVRSSADSLAALAPSVAAALSTADRDLAFSFRPLAEQVNASLAQERLVAMLAGFFGLLALLITAVGLYGVTSFTASQGRTEIGIRLALGAQRSAVIGLVLRKFMVAVVAGITIGLVGAAAVTHFLAGMLFGVTARDPRTFVVAALLFTVVATIAAFVPMRRATKGEPLAALRYE
jgi:predicted permease